MGTPKHERQASHALNDPTRQCLDTTPAIPDLDGLEARVRCRLGGQVRGLRLVAQADGLVLEGSAPTYYAKQLAQHAVMEVTPLRVVCNAIEVRPG